MLLQLALERGRAHPEGVGDPFQIQRRADIGLQVFIQLIEEAARPAMARQQRLAGLLGDLAGSCGGIGPGPVQPFERQAHHRQLAVERQILAQMNPVLLDVAGLGVAEMKAPWQALGRKPPAHGDDGGHAGFGQEYLRMRGAATVAPVEVRLLVVEQQPRRQQWAEQRAETLQPLQCLVQRAGVFQRMAGLAVMAGQKPLPEQEAAVVGIQQAFGVADQRDELLGTKLCMAAGDIGIEEPGATQQPVAIDPARQRQVDQQGRLMVRRDEAGVAFVADEHDPLLRRNAADAVWPGPAPG